MQMPSWLSKYLTASFIITSTNFCTVCYELVKKTYAEEKLRDSLKKDVIEVYKEEIDESQSEPLIDLL